MARQNATPAETVNALVAVWSEDFDRYAAGEIDVHEIRCVLCVPCDCPPFGTPDYFALLDKRHGSGRHDPLPDH